MTQYDLLVAKEVALVALDLPGYLETIGRTLDMSDEELIRVREELRKHLNPPPRLTGGPE